MTRCWSRNRVSELVEVDRVSGGGDRPTVGSVCPGGARWGRGGRMVVGQAARDLPLGGIQG